MTDLTKAQVGMLAESGDDKMDGYGYGVELRGSGAWRVARNLQRAKLGSISGDPGDEPPAMFFANPDGFRALGDWALDRWPYSEADGEVT